MSRRARRDGGGRGPLVSAAVLLVAAFAAAPAPAQEELEGPLITVDGIGFDTWAEYTSSPFFAARGARCGTPDRLSRAIFEAGQGGVGAGDCDSGSTHPSAAYDPGGLYYVNVVFHVLMNTACTQGDVSDELIASQIDIFNEDFLALAGTPGAGGVDARIRFRLATVDPAGNPTTGITRDCNTSWFHDSGSYWNTLAWDPNTYLNVYTNDAGGYLGYVPFLPADSGGGLVGSNSDRVVLLWDAVGRDAPIGPPYDQGRTGTHELGHYLGLEHTFNGSSCVATSPGCYTSGDLICDTNPHSDPDFGCVVGATSCSGIDSPIENYMNYTDDTCMELFSLEQSRRMRCTIESYRPDLLVAASELFSDGFESGDTSSWSSTVP